MCEFELEDEEAAFAYAEEQDASRQQPNGGHQSKRSVGRQTRRSDERSRYRRDNEVLLRRPGV